MSGDGKTFHERKTNVRGKKLQNKALSKSYGIHIFKCNRLLVNRTALKIFDLKLGIRQESPKHNYSVPCCRSSHCNEIRTRKLQI